MNRCMQLVEIIEPSSGYKIAPINFTPKNVSFVLTKRTIYSSSSSNKGN
jgi:hypothetical protein